METANPFIFGTEPTLADYSAFTHLWRLSVVSEARDLPSLADDFPLTRWLRAMEALPAVQAAALPESVMAHDLAPYLDGSADGTTARDLGQHLIRKSRLTKTNEDTMTI